MKKVKHICSIGEGNLTCVSDGQPIEEEEMKKAKHIYSIGEVHLTCVSDGQPIEEEEMKKAKHICSIGEGHLRLLCYVIFLTLGLQYLHENLHQVSTNT